ncbi:hypothetical protein AMAG_18980 [Allomyces macrogynus ATCC 38327]|uniref:DNA recombination and repair protein Rad51-like C-terminal domain-containing protein n=1 Tax=Allomyces macrogynus (strain ATCC 38327) TaxID=578462 RepID=A0A0L0SLE8_ALLM3|nr:hypothetical protein AMAG_18980 [Allomyces macrogynus ATCC 38327]|eukprot:KNE63263.1 hypothetical protein AMAG_18980 [Allomyces macrogynus ATCC 38327]
MLGTATPTTSTSPRLATGIAPLDALLGGGFSPHTITELSGMGSSSILAAIIRTLTGRPWSNLDLHGNVHDLAAVLTSLASSTHLPAVLLIYDADDAGTTTTKTVARLRAAKAAHALAHRHGTVVLVAAPTAGAGQISWTAVASTRVVITRDGSTIMGVTEDIAWEGVWLCSRGIENPWSLE